MKRYEEALPTEKGIVVKGVAEECREDFTLPPKVVRRIVEAKRRSEEALP